MRAIRRLLNGESGQDLMEYGLLMALIAIVAIGAITNVGVTIRDVFWNVIASVMASA
jgi:pilus assembly protein Flp/PilA